MQNRYSLVISPSEEIIALVKTMKNELAKEIGWFHSKNSLAHITINEFMASENEIKMIKKQLNTICESLKPVLVHLNAFDSYPNGAFFIAPDALSKIDLKQIMKHLNQSFRVKTLFKNNEPHLSIARQLSPEHIATSYRLFSKSIDLNFVCDSISLRLFNPNIKQFEIISHFEFKNNPKSTFEQGTLF
ncbi:2'-5' RNA ligase family protein [Flavobacterium undicola]|uniref:2'-5' RNA ligase family protein n=1 Tax=Flavobacterium undicola TaxID=1932779 RepID=UPI0013765E72|nr:2'-5' RNA ligase family protein [Flavobacterium undicola]MBA0883481.1 2'-5' RNA ligase family protein [Flavobacterium undicola]